MQYVITKQIAVEAETPEEAATKINEGQTISLSINPRPQQTPTTTRTVAVPQVNQRTP